MEPSANQNDSLLTDTASGPHLEFTRYQFVSATMATDTRGAGQYSHPWRVCRVASSLGIVRGLAVSWVCREVVLRRVWVQLPAWVHLGGLEAREQGNLCPIGPQETGTARECSIKHIDGRFCFKLFADASHLVIHGEVDMVARRRAGLSYRAL